MFFNGRGTCKFAYKCTHYPQISDFWSIYRLILGTIYARSGLKKMEYLFRCIPTSNIAASLPYQRTLVRRKCSAIAKQIMVAIVNSKAITSTLSISLLDTTIYVAQKASTKTIPEPKSCLIRLARALSHEPSALSDLSALISSLSSDTLPYSGFAKFPSLIPILVIFAVFEAL